MFHRITLIGNVGRDPQMRYTPEGVAVTDFSVATKETISKTMPDGRQRSCPQAWQESLALAHLLVDSRRPAPPKPRGAAAARTAVSDDSRTAPQD